MQKGSQLSCYAALACHQLLHGIGLRRPGVPGRLKRRKQLKICVVKMKRGQKLGNTIISMISKPLHLTGGSRDCGILSPSWALRLLQAQHLHFMFVAWPAEEYE